MAPIRMPSPTRRVIVTVLAIAAAMVALYSVASVARRPDPGRAPQLSTAIYVWQRAWSEPVADAVRRAADSCDEFMVLAAEVAADDGRLAADTVAVDWTALAAAARPAWLVIRCNVSVAPVLSEPPADGPAAAFLASLSRRAADAARSGGAAVAGIQLDYDCPTSKLADYARLLADLRRQLPAEALSITALPAWLRSPHFARLVSRCDTFVLQVHSLDPPTTIDRPIHLCRPDAALAAVRAASRAGVPFSVALPTYGYRVAFDDRGNFAALSAEGPLPRWRPGYQERLVCADSDEILPLLLALRSRRPANCSAVAWFRLPVDTDELNWSWTELRAVMDGRRPRAAFAAELRSPAPDLYEVWLSNTGERNLVARQLRLGLRLADQAALQAHDTLRGFRQDQAPPPGAIRLVGPAPTLGPPVMVAWFRLRPKADADRNPPHDPSAATAPLTLTQPEMLP